MSSCSRPPSLSKNFIPFRLNGRWLAVIIIEPSNFVCGKTIDINIAGVVAIPQRTTFIPFERSAFVIAISSFGPESLESRPIPTVRFWQGLPVFLLSQTANAPPIFKQASSVRLISSPSTPLSAIPRMSLPFCNFNNSSFVIKILYSFT